MDFHIFRLFRLISVAFFILHGSCYSDKAGYYSFSKDATSAPMLSHFDYIVIGGGTAGCAIAATLSQNATVLVLERGGSPYDNPTATDIGNFLSTFLNTTPNSWSQLFISEDGVFNTRARVLGGGTVLNAGFYSRAEDEFVAQTGWVREEVEAAYEWVEKKLVFEPQIKGWQTAFIDGLLEVGVTPYNGFTYEHVHGTKVGGTIFDPDGRRHTAANLLEYADPQKITVYLHASVHKILFTTTGPSIHSFPTSYFSSWKSLRSRIRECNPKLILLSDAFGGCTVQFMLSVTLREPWKFHVNLSVQTFSVPKHNLLN